MYQFRTGLTVSQAKKDAKRLAKERNIPLSEAQNIVAIVHGDSSWHSAMDRLQNKFNPPKTIDNLKAIVLFNCEIKLKYFYRLKLLNNIEIDDLFLDRRKAMDVISSGKKKYDIAISTYSRFGGVKFLDLIAKEQPQMTRVLESGINLPDNRLSDYRQQRPFHYFIEKANDIKTFESNIQKFYKSYNYGTPVKSKDVMIDSYYVAREDYEFDFSFF